MSTAHTIKATATDKVMNLHDLRLFVDDCERANFSDDSTVKIRASMAGGIKAIEATDS